VWSYLNSLLELSRDHQTNHPGMLMFDEPRQQSAHPVSFQQLLMRVANSAQFAQQVIFATSEEPSSLSEMLAGVPHKMISFDGRLLKPM
jgi:hypothetical protein